MKTSAGFTLPMNDAGRKILRSLKTELALAPETKERRRWTILDTFDWRLLSAGCVLLREKRACELHRCEGDELIARSELPITTKNAYAQDFPAGTLRDKVSDPLDIRAAMPRAECIRDLERHRVLNKDGKTTVRLELETLSRPVARQKPMPFQRIIRVVALKGYESEAAKTAQYIESLGLDVHSDTRHFAFAALEASSVTPFDYCSKIKLELEVGASAREACTQILVSSYGQMQANVSGMLADIDSEFLHDYRVALRRTRSLLQIVKGVYPEAEVLRFKQELGDVMRSTNRLRDLDVYLLEQDAYAKLLPPALRPGLDGFFGDLRKERTGVFKKFTKEFSSPTVKRKLKAWETFLHKRANQSSPDCADGDLPVEIVARKLLHKRFKRIIKDGRKITDSTPDEAVHELRIQFKKLRYLLEFFRSLFNDDELNFLIKRSRKMQNVLGNFNDVCVQQETITHYLASINLKRADSVQLCAALGALVAELERKRHAIREKYRDAFRTLDDAKVLATVEHLFHVPADEEAQQPEPLTTPTPPAKNATKKATKKTTTRRRTKKKSAQ